MECYKQILLAQFIITVEVVRLSMLFAILRSYRYLCDKNNIANLYIMYSLGVSYFSKSHYLHCSCEEISSYIRLGYSVSIRHM